MGVGGGGVGEEEVEERIELVSKCSGTKLGSGEFMKDTKVIKKEMWDRY